MYGCSWGGALEGGELAFNTVAKKGGGLTIGEVPDPHARRLKLPSRPATMGSEEVNLTDILLERIPEDTDLLLSPPMRNAPNIGDIIPAKKGSRRE
jgi:hypothetical protein